MKSQIKPIRVTRYAAPDGEKFDTKHEAQRYITGLEIHNLVKQHWKITDLESELPGTAAHHIVSFLKTYPKQLAILLIQWYKLSQIKIGPGETH